MLMAHSLLCLRLRMICGCKLQGIDPGSMKDAKCWGHKMRKQLGLKNNLFRYIQTFAYLINVNCEMNFYIKLVRLLEGQ